MKDYQAIQEQLIQRYTQIQMRRNFTHTSWDGFGHSVYEPGSFNSGASNRKTWLSLKLIEPSVSAKVGKIAHCYWVIFHTSGKNP